MISPYEDDVEACRRAIRHVMDTVTVRLGASPLCFGFFMAFFENSMACF